MELAKSLLGFGMMRLPVINGNASEIDFEKLNPMVDAFMEAGFNYFDTSYVYHNGMSEEAVKKAVVERYPREKIQLATKFPPFILQEEAQIEPIFKEQLQKLGVDYVNYYMIHNVQTVFYDGLDGKGGILQKVHLFEHMKKWKETGRAKNIGISFHSSPALLERVLTEHPELDFVQLAINYIDWDSEMVQAKSCYEIARKHGKQVIVMEPVKGGGLASLPQEAERILKAESSEQSVVSWAFRFLASLDGIITILSGMSTIGQVQDNIKTIDGISPLSDKERDALGKAVKIYRDSAPIPTDVIEKYRGLTYHGLSATAILETYSICQVQPNPAFTDDINYPKNALAENVHVDIDCDESFPEETVLLPDGTDGTPLLKQAEGWLRKYHF